MAEQLTFKEKLNMFLAGEYRMLEDRNVTEALPSIIANILEAEKNRVAERLIEGMVAGLTNREKSIRQQCSSCLAKTATMLAEKDIWQPLDQLLPSLKVIQEGGSGDGVPEDVRKATAKVITAAENRGDGKKPAPLERTEEKEDSVAILEEQIFHLHEAGKMDEAKRQLFDLIVSCARKKDFKNAERLRERIYEIDSMALVEILQSGEIIEEEKSSSIDGDIPQVWSSLLNVLTPEEFNNLFLTMDKREIKSEETLVSQGTRNDELFFINRGSLRISYFQTGAGGGKEIFVENLDSGNIIGENFVNATVWTVSLTAVQKSQISILKRDDLALLEEKNPGIESKLMDYSVHSFNIANLLNRKGLNRRTYERFRVRRTIHLKITGKTGKLLSSFNGAMADISLGGLSFVVNIIKKETSRHLLGRDIKVTIPITQGGEQELDGTVIGVNLRESISGNFSVHVKFNSLLERQTLKLIIE